VRKFLLIAMIIGCSGARVWAQSGLEDQIYEAGTISLRVGVSPLFPLYVHAFNFSNFAKSSMKIGFTLHLGVDYYLTNNLKLGGNVSFGSLRGVNSNLSFLVPINFRVDWEFHALRFDFPVGVDIGILFNRYRNMFAFNFMIAPHAGAFYNITRSWSVGLDARFWLVPQAVWDDLPKSRVGTFIELTIAGRYRI
jgi:hypothetical protein